MSLAILVILIILIATIYGGIILIVKNKRAKLLLAAAFTIFLAIAASYITIQSTNSYLRTYIDSFVNPKEYHETWGDNKHPDLPLPPGTAFNYRSSYEAVGYFTRLSPEEIIDFYKGLGADRFSESGVIGDDNRPQIDLVYKGFRYTMEVGPSRKLGTYFKVTSDKLHGTTNLIEKEESVSAKQQMVRIADLVLNEGKIDSALVSKDRIEGSASINTAAVQISFEEIKTLLNKIQKIRVRKLTSEEEKEFLIDNGRLSEVHISVELYAEGEKRGKTGSLFKVWEDGTVLVSDVTTMYSDKRTISYLTAEQYPELFKWLDERLKG
ncbi:hypothetical protein MFMK1_003588 [Metallumcola ferriviriculae]|uniref:Uncharacterized protein n=1 Tax=Metallumcola ferriviriculae TaxID=3039180 RepID=A0AAU0UUX4_9FIRM|nr:hypothetical protein MFMK1_003588 [Desulfitibacteraceae bacterium MK1]